MHENASAAQRWACAFTFGFLSVSPHDSHMNHGMTTDRTPRDDARPRDATLRARDTADARARGRACGTRSMIDRS